MKTSLLVKEGWATVSRFSSMTPTTWFQPLDNAIPNISTMKYAPRDIFEQILDWSVVPTFDLVIEIEGRGYLMVKRKIEPYKNQWALPGLRMHKGESIDDTLARIAKQEVGINLDSSKKTLIGQYVGKFKSEHHRQDLSTGYYFKLPASTVVELNYEHFSSYTLSVAPPGNTGAMYRHYINLVAENKL